LAVGTVEVGTQPLNGALLKEAFIIIFVLRRPHVAQVIAGKEAEAMTQTQRAAAIKQMIKAYTVAHGASQASARAALIKEGFHKPNGDLKSEYGGKIQRKRQAA
jgi:hypothetical protein